MTSLTISPLTFNSKKGEVFIDKEIIKWKKQKATLSKKKNSSAIDYLNTNYSNLINNGKGGIVFAYFEYNNDTTIYLMYSLDSKIKTELNYDLYLPSYNNIEIVEETYDIEKTDDKIIIQGKVFAFCLDNQTYYFKKINIDEYIEYVQRNNNINDENLYDEYDLNKDEDNDDEKSNKDSDSDNEENDEEDINDIINDEIINEEDDEDINDEEDDEEDAEDADEGGDEDDTTEAVDYEEPNGDDDNEELVNLEVDDDIFKKNKRKKRTTKKNKNIKTINIDDLSILSNILKQENKEIIIPEKDLYIKRQQSLKILKKIKLPYKTIQIIEKGIYNYTINKCDLRQTIPLWENIDFTNIYINKVKNIYLNLNSKEYIKNVNLIEKVKKNEILPYELAFLDTHKLFPEVWADIIDEKTKIEKMLRESLEESASDLFKCPRCYKRKTIHCEVQTRSSDEPMTTFITCLECGKKWKIY
jgi:DNA-directed RNA polymerase subunit M/transcription elongation factor TFIIS